MQAVPALHVRCYVLLLVVQGSVQQQLEELCDLSPVCAPARLKRQKEANAQLRVEVEILRMQLQRSQAQIQRLQQQQQQDEAAQAAGQD